MHATPPLRTSRRSPTVHLNPGAPNLSLGPLKPLRLPCSSQPLALGVSPSTAATKQREKGEGEEPEQRRGAAAAWSRS